MSKEIIDRDCICFLSEVGHNNFFYPDLQSPALIKMGSVVEEISWVKFNGLLPVKVKREDLYETKEIKSKTCVIWLRKEYMKNEIVKDNQ